MNGTRKVTLLLYVRIYNFEIFLFCSSNYIDNLTRATQQLDASVKKFCLFLGCACCNFLSIRPSI
jgi:hypothetical protein